MNIEFTKLYVVVKRFEPFQSLMVLTVGAENTFYHYGEPPCFVPYSLREVMERIKYNNGFYVEFDNYQEALDYIETLQSLEEA